MASTKEASLHIIDIVGLGKVEKSCVDILVNFQQQKVMEIVISTNGEELPKSGNKVLDEGRFPHNSQIIDMNAYSADQVVPAQRKIEGRVRG
jgi:hypothetical protein